MAGLWLASHTSDAAAGTFGLSIQVLETLFVLFRVLAIGVGVVTTQALGGEQHEAAQRTALVGLGASYVASYERARGRSLGYAGSEGFLYRAVRALLLVLGLLSGWIEAALWAFVGLTILAAALRAWSVAEQHRASFHGGRVE